MKNVLSNVMQTCAAAAIAGLALLGAPAAASPADAEALPKLAVLDTQLIDYVVTRTGEPMSTPEDVARIKLVSDVLRERMAETGLFEVLPKQPETGAWEDAVDLTCPYCILDIAERQGADFVMTSAVIRTSTIIVYLRAELDNVATGKAVTVGDVMFKNFDNEDQVRGGADYWLRVHGDDLKEAMQRLAGNGQEEAR